MIDTGIVINTDLYNISNIRDELLDSLHDIQDRCEFVLNKYTWDRKKVYESTHSYMVQETRDTLAQVLVEMRRLKR